jgi:hypothetical protein
MFPVEFPESNITFVMPTGMPGGDLRAYIDREQIATAWRPTPQELVRLNMGEPLFLRVLGNVQPPVALSVGSPFITQPVSTPDESHTQD